MTDAETVEGIKLLARTEGIFTEAAGGVTIATLRKLAQSGDIGVDELTVAYVTGNGLKTQEAVDGHVSVSVTIDPTMGSFEDAMDSRQQADMVWSAPQVTTG